MTTLPAFRPLGDRILIRRTGAEKRTSGGLYIPEVARDKVSSGEILHVGPEVKSKELVRGVTVVFGKYSENEIEIEGEKFCVLREDRILGVMETCEVSDG